VRWRGEPVLGPTEGVAMVFQSFALFPWLAVEENVELGLESQGVPMVQFCSSATSTTPGP